jgi:hypothetical protein
VQTANPFFRSKSVVSGISTDLNRAQIVRGGHDVLSENRDPFYVSMPFRRRVRRCARWWGEERSEKRGIRDEHGFQNGQKRRAAICQGDILGGEDGVCVKKICEGIQSKAVNKRRTGCGVLWIQLMAAHLSKRGDRLLELEGPVIHRSSTGQTEGKAYKPRITEYSVVSLLAYPIHARFLQRCDWPIWYISLIRKDLILR